MRGKTALLVAAALGILAAVLSWKSIDHEQRRVREGWTLMPIVVASQDAIEGTVLEYSSVASFEAPEKFVTPSVVRPDQIDKVIGQRLAVPVHRGDPILWSFFRTEGTFESLSNAIGGAGRAITLDVDYSRGVAGWIRPGDRVDVLGTFTNPKDSQLVAVTLMQNVVVMATDSNSGVTDSPAVVAGEGKRRGYGSVTMMVLPEEAEVLTLAMEMGSLRLTLRNPSNIGMLQERNLTTLDYLLTGERRQEIMKLRERMPEIIHPPSMGGSSGR